MAEGEVSIGGVQPTQGEPEILYGTPVKSETTRLTPEEELSAKNAMAETQVSNLTQDASHRTVGPDGKMVVDTPKVADLIRNQNAPNPIKQPGS